jgi:hypothetical protein
MPAQAGIQRADAGLDGSGLRPDDNTAGTMT